MRAIGRQWCIALVTVVVGGCSAQHASYRSGAEIPEGPGMFSGQEGGFALHAEREANGAAAASTQEAPTGSEAEFREFQRWREANRDTPEYREFLDWREWRDWKAFQAWRRRQR